MNRKLIITVGLVIILSIAGVIAYKLTVRQATPSYRFVTVERGDIRSTVSATGTLDAVTTVSVGTQVSGQVSELFVDFNDQVTKGQLLARIDPTLALQAVADAQANVERSEAQARQAASDASRNRELASEGLVATSANEVAQASAAVARASVTSARVGLDRARQNLEYTSIYAPIAGVVVTRNVDRGQTVAASLSAPELFRIANDLTQMQILAQVGESDIALIREAQPVEFTVQALQGQTFQGTVKQVRLQSTTADNVVNYTVVVSVDNTQGKLMPGMTARTDFVTNSADGVLGVANAALRYKPADAQLATLDAGSTKDDASTTRSDATGPTPQRARPASRNGASNPGTLYYLGVNGELARTRVTTGITDGSTTEVSGKDLHEGMKVIAGTVSATQQGQSTTTPFQPAQQGGGTAGGRRGGF